MEENNESTLTLIFSSPKYSTGEDVLLNKKATGKPFEYALSNGQYIWHDLRKISSPFEFALINQEIFKQDISKKAEGIIKKIILQSAKSLVIAYLHDNNPQIDENILEEIVNGLQKEYIHIMFNHFDPIFRDKIGPLLKKYAAINKSQKEVNNQKILSPGERIWAFNHKYFKDFKTSLTTLIPFIQKDIKGSDCPSVESFTRLIEICSRNLEELKKASDEYIKLKHLVCEIDTKSADQIEKMIEEDIEAVNEIIRNRSSLSDSLSLTNIIINNLNSTIGILEKMEGELNEKRNTFHR